MNYELFLATRYLNGLRRSQPVVSVIAMISVLGIALGVAALLVVLGVMTGFDSDLEEKIVGANPHLLVQVVEGGIPDPGPVLDQIRKIPGVAAASPVLQTQVLIRHGTEAVGVLLRGVDPEGEASVTRLVQSIKKGNWPPGPDELFVGSELARRWGLRIGAPVELVGGEKAKPHLYRVAGVFTSGMYEYDMHLTLASIAGVQNLLGPGAQVTGIGVRIQSAVRAPEMKQTVQRQLGYPYWTISWMDMNSNLFAALKLEKITMFLILTLIVLVACFNIVATLLMLVVGKTKEIGILKAIGATGPSTRKIFTSAGLLIGLAGTGLGTVLGLGLCAALKKYQFVQLPAEIYYLDHLPVKLDTQDTLTVVVAALIISWIACLYPAWVAARMEPAKALRYE